MKKVFSALAILGVSIMALTSCNANEPKVIAEQIGNSVEKNDEGIIVCENCEIRINTAYSININYGYYKTCGPVNHCEFENAKLIQYDNFFEIYVNNDKFIFSNNLATYTVQILEGK